MHIHQSGQDEHIQNGRNDYATAITQSIRKANSPAETPGFTHVLARQKTMAGAFRKTPESVRKFNPANLNQKCRVTPIIGDG